MNENKFNSFLKKFFLYLLYIVIVILLSSFLFSVSGILLRLLFPSVAGTNVDNLIDGISGFILELLFLFLLFNHASFNNKSISIGNDTFIMAAVLLIQAVISYVMHFAVIVSGAGTTFTGMYLYGLILGDESIKFDYVDVPIKYFLIPLIIKIILYLFATASGIFIGKKRRLKDNVK